MKIERSFLEELAEKFVEKARTLFEDVAIVLHAGSEYMAKYANNVITIVQSWTRTNVSLYLSRNQRIYHGVMVVSSGKQLEGLLTNIDKTIDMLDPTPFYAPLPEPSGQPLTNLVDPKLRESPEIVSEYAAIIIDTVTSNSRTARTAGMVETVHGYRVVATSRGDVLAEEHTSITGYARVFEGNASGHWAWTSRSCDEKAVEDIGLIALDYARKAAKAPRITVEPGEYTAILSPLVVGNLIDTVGFMASGLAILMGFSFLAKYSLGDTIAAQPLTLLDDPEARSLPFSTGFDDEGVKTKRKPIIEKGVLKNILHNTRTAKALQSKTTGNAGLLMPHPWNLVIEPGDSSLDEMIAETRRGLLVNNNWYTRFQSYYEGVFSTVTRDSLLYIENGEIKGSVARLRIADTMPRLLNSISLLGKERYQVKWWEVDIPVLSPYVMLEKIRFTKPEV